MIVGAGAAHAAEEYEDSRAKQLGEKTADFIQCRWLHFEHLQATENRTVKD